jgi:predicted transcriptional regulator
MQQRILIRKLEKPKVKDVQRDIDWVVDSFGWSSGRDVESTATKIVEALLKRFADRVAVESKMIADDLDMNAHRVNHHIRNLIDAGVLYRRGREIYLRGGTVKEAVEEMRKDANRIFDEIEDIAEEIDDALGYTNRE